MMTKILLADDHDLVRMTLAEMLQRRRGFVVTEAGDLTGALTALNAMQSADLVLLDYTMPGMTLPDGLRRIVAANGGGPVALLTGTGNADVARRAQAAGARGFVTKSLSPDRLLGAVDRLLAGERVFDDLDAAPGRMGGRAATPTGVGLLSGAAVGSGTPDAPHLTPRELDVLRGLCAGLANKEIARDLDVQEVTVKLHVKTLSRKLQAKNRTHAAILAKDLRLI